MSAAALRESISKRRDALSSEERESKSEEICKRLLRLPEFQAAEQALFYVSFRSEVDTALMRQCSRDAGQQVAAPRGNPRDKSMTFYFFDSDAELESGPFGILQPPARPERKLDLSRPSVIVVPGLVFDRHCNRLGWGEGYYDRFLGGAAKAHASIGLAFDCQFVERIPVEAHDVPLHAVISETELFRP